MVSIKQNSIVENKEESSESSSHEDSKKSEPFVVVADKPLGTLLEQQEDKDRQITSLNAQLRAQ